MADPTDSPQIPEMVERVARALIAVAEHGLNTDADRIVNDAYGNPAHPAWQDYVEDATEAIKAMREPSTDMIAAGIMEAKRVGGPWLTLMEGMFRCPETWKAMIDASLKEL